MESAVSAQLLGLFEHTDTLVAAYDSSDRLRYSNQAFRSAFFIAEGEELLWSDLMRRNFKAQRGTIISRPDFEGWLKSTLSRRGKTGFRAFETSLHDGRWLWMTEAVQANHWMLCIATEVTKLRQKGRAVRQNLDNAIKAAHTDELTGIANRRFVSAKIEDLLSQPAVSGVLGSICVLDLDNFKFVNDRFGHQAGDTILRDFSDRIQGLVRRSDCFGRIGGEEFLLVLPHANAQVAGLVVERMLAAVRKSRPLKQWPQFEYTFSAGIAEAQPGDSVDELYARADNALYAAKSGGRNRIHLFAA